MLVKVAPRRHVLDGENVGGYFRCELNVGNGVHICFPTETISNQEDGSVATRHSRQGTEVSNTNSDTSEGLGLELIGRVRVRLVRAKT